jgi:hypothetical protein
MRTRTLLLLATGLTLATVGLAVVSAGATDRHVRPDQAPAARSRIARALAVLRAWDRDRAAAWSHADPAALARLYLRRSRTGTRDAAHLRRWRDRGLRVTGLHQQVAAVRVDRASPGRIALTVTDRTVDAVAVGHGRRTALPASAWATHRITLRAVHGRWRVAEVVAQPAR